MRLEHPTAGKVQQGAIFNCVTVPSYEGCPCHGLVLTARCDLEHGKYTAINYLPVVRFSDWSKREMCNLLARRLHKSVHGALTKALRDKQVTAYVRNTFPLRNIIEKETAGKDRDTLLAKLAQLDVIESVISLGGRYTSHGSALTQVDGKLCDTLIKDLIQGKLSEYYFLDAVDIYDSHSEGYVVLLRKMQTLEAEFATQIATGLDLATHQPAAFAPFLSNAHAPICMITGVLRSPDIEHLAQHFANLFVRIGLEDHEEQTIERHQLIAKG